ncbi:retrovirus-related pol polyprotein from transposon TNT 1-94 [Tanacetum coccineum]
MTTLAEHMIVDGAENRPPMLDKTIKLQYDCDVQATNIVLQGLPPDVYALINHCQTAKDIWDRVKLLMQGDDPIACLNKAMAFMSTVMASRFPSTNNQLRTSSNPRNQATIQDGRVTIQQVQGRQGQSFAGMGNKGNATSSRGNNVADAYYSDCDDISSAKAVLMANLSSGSDVLSEDKVNRETKTVNESLTTELERYKERVKTFEQRLNVNLSSREKFIDSQMDDIIQNRNALKQEIDSLKQTLSKQVKEKELLLQTFTVFKKESKEKENKYMDKEIDLEKKIKELDNIVYKVGQSTQTVHMLAKPQVFYVDTHKQALGYQNPFYLKKAQRIKPTLYDGIVISKKHDVIFVVDEEETLILDEESRLKMLAKQNDPILKEKEINIFPINYSEWNKLSEDFGKRFVPQMQLSAEQTFWLQLSNPKSEQLVVTQTPVEIEVFKEEVIPFINSLRASFKDFENGLHSEINEVKTVFNQMKAAVEQCSVDKKYFNIQKKELSLDMIELLGPLDYLSKSYDILMNEILKPYLSYLYVFGALCYPTNDSEDLGKLKPKVDIGIFVGYAPAKKVYRIYNKRTRLIIETIHVDFDKLTVMASKQFSSGPGPQLLTPGTLSLVLVPKPPSPTPVTSLVPVVVAPEPADSTGTPSSTTIDQDAPSPSTSQAPHKTQSLVIPSGVEEEFHDIEVAHLDNDPFFGVPIPEPNSEESSSRDVIPINVHSVNQPLKHLRKWIKDHPLDNVIGNPSRPISTRHQLQNEAMF